MDYWELLLGWGLGIASQPITTWVSELNDRKRFLGGLKSELIDARFRLTSIAAAVAPKIGRFDRLHVIWLKEELQAYTGEHPRDQFVDGLQGLLDLDENNMAALQAYLTARNATTGSALTPIDLPYLESKMDAVPLLTEKQQSLLLNARRSLTGMNAKIDDVGMWLRMTFEATTDANHRRAIENERVSLGALFMLLKKAAGEIKEFLETLE